MLSPGFFASRFILDVELPRLLGPDVDKVLPMMLKRVPVDGSWNLHSVDTRQIFTSRGRCFTETRGPSRGRFALELATEIRRRVLSDAA